jgi:6-phosphogluconolactonase
MNELNSTVDVLIWNANDRALMPIQNVKLLPEDGDKTVVNTGCDTVLTRDGRFAYFANRGNNFLIAFQIDEKTGKLTPLSASPRIPSGGKTPRNFRLDPTEQWVLVANQGSANLSVFPRNPKTGELNPEGKSFPCPTPMCIVFV